MFSSFNTPNSTTRSKLTHFGGVDVDLLCVQNVDFAAVAHQLLHTLELDFLLLGLLGRLYLRLALLGFLFVRHFTDFVGSLVGLTLEFWVRLVKIGHILHELLASFVSGV